MKLLFKSKPLYNGSILNVGDVKLYENINDDMYTIIVSTYIGMKQTYYKEYKINGSYNRACSVYDNICKYYNI